MNQESTDSSLSSQIADEVGNGSLDRSFFGAIATEHGPLMDTQPGEEGVELEQSQEPYSCFIASPSSSTHDTTTSANASMAQSSDGSLDDSVLLQDTSSTHPWLCEYCSKTFAKRHDYNRHNRYHLKRHRCTVCMKAFALPKDVERHLNSCHGEGEQLLCGHDRCSYKSPRKDNMQRHRKTHVEGKKRGRKRRLGKPE
ncbi:hypothetical protein F5884DRAFT_801759 [Xylogone sp. PMI_703]|nr:hypothetical protein F5884DRAFT_801759 [Xylogone sp. PMI_703]